MGRLRNTLAVAAIGAALTATSAQAAETAAPAVEPAASAPPPASETTTPAPITPSVHQGSALVAPPSASKPSKPGAGGGTPAKRTGGHRTGGGSSSESSAGATAAPLPSQVFSVPSIPSSTCAAAGVPPILIPMYQRAAATYGLGPQGAAVLAGINEVETAFGTNLNISSAGAEGWMQFMPSTWDMYGVDANGDGVADPYNPEDAIFAAARYLRAAGMPGDTYGAIFAYNHADWYVAEVLANASCYAPLVGGAAGALPAPPQLQVLACKPAKPWRGEVPAKYMAAFDSAAGRYELGEAGVWALAAVARLESNFGRNLPKAQLGETGPLGLDASEWRHYAVDGDGDGRIDHASPADSAATLARLIWSKGSLRAGIFVHNQAAWYVQAVLDEARQIEGACRAHYVDWQLALPADATGYVNPFGLSVNLVTGRIDQGVDFVGEGAIVAIGDAKVLRVGAPGWPEEGGVLYQLLDGPLKGETIFVYEGVDATVQAGQTVKAGEQIATFRPGGSIEIGFADAAGTPLSHGEYYEGKVTQSGLEMMSFLQALGV
jgi:murein DD-endopeptidase MepM/ murein hydrolase activator NlpD